MIKLKLYLRVIDFAMCYSLQRHWSVS